MLERDLRSFVSQPEWPLADVTIKWAKKSPVAAQRAMQHLGSAKVLRTPKPFWRPYPQTRSHTRSSGKAVIVMLKLIASPDLLLLLQGPLVVKHGNPQQSSPIQAPPPTTAMPGKVQHPKPIGGAVATNSITDNPGGYASPAPAHANKALQGNDRQAAVR
ncbi:MAG TPA: hypothetical protein DGG94_23335 [Micromonosporaceae bacterium]|nr:hypothetical protein [Micromonosporaceae bacterium]HCU52684.1 hypothetical protein [Micromonosporaceae bacterium]